MKSIKALVIAAAAVISAVPATAGEKLSYLSSMDADALNFFRCAASVGATRELLLEDGFDVYTSFPGTFDKAGRAAVIKAALLAEEFQEGPKLKHVSFTGKRATRLVASDIDAHRNKADRDLATGTFVKGLDDLASCVSPSRLDAARAMVDWLDNDVGLFEDLK
ncbi:hypothetical protein HFO56_00540 [Rhizobium laguerreae]|uniref:hypothetical protein n=1 Tax=Rhizobium laguerreae TaxID=1076926 RepID=UPI001C913F28|nr:hypothetical protein [Rhizobium laguerreae]MBY3150916.1 hypothetical protein [Rhizobium laguerreae]